MRWFVPLAVFALVAATALIVWQLQRAAKRELLVQRTQDVCFQAARRLENYLQSHLRLATVFGKRWAGHGRADFSQERFREFGELILHEIPGFGGLALLLRDGQMGWSVPGVDNWLQGLPPNALRGLAGHDGAAAGTWLSAPIEVEGLREVLAAVPLERDREFLGYLVVMFVVDAMINDCFHGNLQRLFDFWLSDGTASWYATRPASTPAADAGAGAQIQSVRSFSVLNRTWSLTLVPRHELSSRYDKASTLPVLWFGLALALGLGILVHLLLARIELLRQARDVQARLARTILNSQEEERARVSRDLHDELGQVLTALRLEAGWLARSNNSGQEDRSRVVSQVIEMIDRATSELRRVCRGLRPPALDDLGLVPAVRMLIDDFQARSAARVELSLPSDWEAKLPADLTLCMYRILQEALSNIQRHARAERVWIRVQARKDRVQLQVEDDGVGFDASLADAGYGIDGMKERAALVRGSLQVRTRKNEGTTICFEAPFPKTSDR